MSVQKTIQLVGCSLLAGLVLSTTPTLFAAPPIFSLMPFRKVEVDANKDYKLTEKNGPWMIMATNFAGEEGEAQARKLVLELRRDYQLPAYVFHHTFDYTASEVGLGVDKYGRPKKMRPLNNELVDEWAVVVGNFKTYEDPDASSALEKIRTAQVKSAGVVMSRDARGNPKSMSKAREYFSKLTFQKSESQPRGPLGKAFLTRNPLLPPEKVAKGSLDPFVKELNSGIEHSLLQNKHKYTVQVATFRGATAFSEEEFNETLKKNKNTAKIDEAAIKATKLVAALRKQGIDAYVFHDRYESLVTVGAFDDLGSEGLSGGRVELQPAVAKVIKQYEAERKPIPGSDQVALSPRSLNEIPFDVSPQLIMVPRENLADVYGQREN